MLGDAFRYPLGDRITRDALAVCTGLVVVVLLLMRLGRALWPSPFVVVPFVVAVFPAALFAGYLGSVLTADLRLTSSPAWSARTLRQGVRLLVVAAGYLLPAVVALVLTAYVILNGGGGMLLTLAPTVALLTTVASLYVLPAALAATATDGVLAGFSRSSLAGLASGSYFFAWTVAVSLVVSVWSLLAAATTATLAALVLTVVLVYAHVVAARLLRLGLARSRWEPPSPES